MGITLTTVQGKALARYISDMARLRIEVFHDFPYLYDGDLAYEEGYLQTYLDSERAAIVLALDGEQVVGASSCLPMADEEAVLQQAFLDHGKELFGEAFKLDQLFYFAESVLDKRYRGRGIGVDFFKQREAHARQMRDFKYTCFAAVDRPVDHPLRPSNYMPLDGFWQKRGYRKQTQLKTHYVWKDIDQPRETRKSMTFWTKQLSVL